jgi:hypothetical protein
VLLWIIAPCIAKLAAEPNDGENSGFQASPSEFHAIAISTLGIFIVVTHLPDIVFIFWQWTNAEEISTFGGNTKKIFKEKVLVHTAQTTLYLALGFILIAGASFWACVLRRFREFGDAPSRN